MEQIGSIGKVVLSRLIGFVIFIILLLVANMLVPYVGNSIFSSIVSFLNLSIYAIVIFTILLLMGEMFGVLMFPFNLPAPLFNAIGGIFLVKFIFDLIIFVDSLIVMPVSIPYEAFRNLAYVLVFLLVIIIGYVTIFVEAGRRENSRRAERVQKKSKKK